MRVVLVEPQIPQNTGSVGRLCAGLGIPLHLIEPLGFELSDRYLKRAGLDYWPAIDLRVHPRLEDALDGVAPGDTWYFSARAATDFWDVPIGPNAALVFGREADGLPAALQATVRDRLIRIPHGTKIRSLNLANAVSVAVYEGLRQQREQRE